MLTDAVLERYPELFFRLNYFPHTPSSHPRELSLQSKNGEGIDVIYVYGLYLAETLITWLEGAKERRLIFLEDELGAVAEYAHSEKGEILFSHPQIEIHFLSEELPLQEVLEELVARHPTDRVEIYAIEPYQTERKELFEEIRLTLLRLSTVMQALMAEALFSHKLLPNLLANIKRWPGSFFAEGLRGKFKNIPAIICGAGPSLEHSFSLLKNSSDRALIIAGGSTIAALSNHGITPHLGLALDPNREEFDRLKMASSYEMPLLFASRLQSEVLLTTNAERGYLHSATGGPFENELERALGIEREAIGPELGSEALSVTTLALALAVEMGCNPILLNGIDLAYTGMRRYAAGVMPSSSVVETELEQEKKAGERLLERTDISGQKTFTLVKWVMESECIAAFAKAHPEVQFYNVSPGGLGFEGIPNRSLQEVIEQECHETLDLHSLVHGTIQSLKIPLSKEAVAHELQKIKESLQRLLQIAEEMIAELTSEKRAIFPSGKMTLLELDFEEEKAYSSLFSHVIPALERLIDRKFPSLQGDLLEQKSLAKWQQLQEMIAYELNLFS